MSIQPDSSRKSQESPFPLRLWWVACVLIIGSIAVGLYMTGGPQWQRILRLDEQRSASLSALEQQIESYVQQHGRLPASMAALLEAGDLSVSRTKDPVTEAPYGYQKLSDTSFQLCADFQADTKSNVRRHRNVPVYDASQMSFYKHPAGRYCFVRKQLPRPVKGGPWPERDVVMFGPAGSHP